MIGLITSMVGGVFAAVSAILIGASGGWALAAGIVGTGVIFVAAERQPPSGPSHGTRRQLETLFPTPTEEAPLTTDR